MAMTLDQWQERLQSHFAQLASDRAHSDFPVFALEHGLSDEEFDEITRLLRGELLDGWKLGRYWLLWVVYATELGYDYDGGEYWPSFEERTPHWRQPITATRRNQLRSWFARFQTTYHTIPTAQILEALSRWSRARLLGPLVTMRRNRILERIANKLYARLCGQRWADAEADYLRAPGAGFARQKLLDVVGAPQGFSMVLSRESDRMEAGGESGFAWFFGVAARYQVSSNQGLCAFALRLAGSPQDVPGMVPTSDLLNALLSDIKEKDSLLRGARLVALLCASRNPGPYGGSFPRWTW